MNRYCNPPTKATYRSPVYDVRAVPVEKVVANSYNPNVVAPPEMKLLELSIWEDGYTMPCVCYYDAEKDLYELVDGYHRYRCSSGLNASTNGRGACCPWR